MEFYMERPRKPWSDWRMWSMLVPILVSAVGFFVTGVFAFAFSDINVIPAYAQSIAVILGSALIIFGAELNTPFSVIEVFRKAFKGQATPWDWTALIASLVGTLINLLVTFASRLSLATIWKVFVLAWGPLLSGVAVACDYYGALVELGFLFGSYENRMETYIAERRVFLARQAEQGPSDAGSGRDLGDPATWPAGTSEDLERVLPSLNGQTATLTRAGLAEAYARIGRTLPSRSTIRRHLEIAHAYDERAN